MKPEDYLQNVKEEYTLLRKQAEKAMAQVTEADFFAVIGEEGNSIAVIVKHLAGNLISRWTDFLTSDGEKPDRNRDSEFEAEDSDIREKLLQRWEKGWSLLFQTLDSLRMEDLDRTIYIRCKAHKVYAAIHRNLTHTAGHVGQIFYLARHWAGPKWQSLSLPKGKSKDYNVQVRGK